MPSLAKFVELEEVNKNKIILLVFNIMASRMPFYLEFSFLVSTPNEYLLTPRIRIRQSSHMTLRHNSSLQPKDTYVEDTFSILDTLRILFVS